MDHPEALFACVADAALTSVTPVPVGYRPAALQSFITDGMDDSLDVPVRLRVATTGVITMTVAAGDSNFYDSGGLCGIYQTVPTLSWSTV